MSEITRYDCEEDRSCEYEVKAVMRVDPIGYYVRHADHLVYLNEMRMDRDAQRLRADTAEARVKTAEHDLEFFKAGKNEQFDRAEAAEQRIAELTELLISGRKVVSDAVGLVEEWADVLRKRMGAHCSAVDAALNPNPEAESHDRIPD